jgi:hypothetical protein
MAVAASRGASGKLAAAIASGKGTPDRRWNRAGLAAGIDHCFVWAMLRDHDGGIARDPLRRFRGNVAGRAVDFHGGVTDVRTARGLRRVQRRPIDMDHDLVPIARSAPIEIASERDFGQPRRRMTTMARGTTITAVCDWELYQPAIVVPNATAIKGSQEMLSSQK